MLEASRQHGMEGVIAKRLDSRYEAGARTGAWQKIKLPQREAFVVGGWVPGEAGFRGTLGSLVVGRRDGDRLVCVGSVGTGFTQATRRQLIALLEPLARATSPFHAGAVPPTTRFVEPVLSCDVEFVEVTARGGQLRHPSYKGLRP
jgi:bifunctional non-homologous end joining protein LigD